MWVYFRLQWKRLRRLIPGAAALMLVLALALLLLLRGFVSANQQQNTTKFHIAICGDLDDSLLQLGFSAFQTLDDSRFAMEITQMSLADAKTALQNSEISAYVVFPEGFTDDARQGIIRPLEFVTTPDTQGMVLLFKIELTDMVGDILLSAQRSVFGTAQFMRENGYTDKAAAHMNNLSIEYGKLAFLRGYLTETENLGIGGAENLITYLACGLSVVFLCLCCLSFAPAMIMEKTGVSRMLSARGFSGRKQGFLDFAAEAAGLAALIAAVAALPMVFVLWKGIALPISLLWGIPAVVVTVAALSFFFYSLSGDFIGGVLLQFLGLVSLSFVCGCMYPGFFFPTAVQKLGDWLPMGLCRRWLMGCLEGEADFAVLGAMAGVTVAAVLGGIALRQRRTKAVQGVNA
ncbi:MAG: ABC transporter permease [Faecousia sp.]